MLREQLKEGDKEVAFRVLESDGVIPAPGATLITQTAPHTFLINAFFSCNINFGFARDKFVHNSHVLVDSDAIAFRCRRWIMLESFTGGASLACLTNCLLRASLVSNLFEWMAVAPASDGIHGEGEVLLMKLVQCCWVRLRSAETARALL